MHCCSMIVKWLLIAITVCSAHFIDKDRYISLHPINKKKCSIQYILKKNCIVAEWLVNVFRLLFLSIAIVDNLIKTNNLYTTSSSHQQENLLYIIYIKRNWIAVEWLLNVLHCYHCLLPLFLRTKTDNLYTTSSSHQQEKMFCIIYIKRNWIVAEWLLNVLDCYHCLARNVIVIIRKTANTTSSSHQQENSLYTIYIKRNCIVVECLLNVLHCYCLTCLLPKRP